MAETSLAGVAWAHQPHQKTLWRELFAAEPTATEPTAIPHVRQAMHRRAVVFAAEHGHEPCHTPRAHGTRPARGPSTSTTTKVTSFQFEHAEPEYATVCVHVCIILPGKHVRVRNFKSGISWRRVRGDAPDQAPWAGLRGPPTRLPLCGRHRSLGLPEGRPVVGNSEGREVGGARAVPAAFVT